MTLHIEIEPLLSPVSPENPAGDNLEYDSLFDDIRAARESDPDYLPEDEWAISVPRRADWNLVRTLSERTLIQQSKDLQLACWFVEASSHLQGLAGLLTGVNFLGEFITRFWFQCWPSLDDEGGIIRRGKLVRLDRDLSQCLVNHPLLRHEMTSLSRWRQILAFEHKVNMSPDNRDALIDLEGDLTMASFDKLTTRFSSIEISQQADRVEQLMVAFRQLEVRYQILSQDKEGELFMLTQHTLTDIADYLQRLSQRAIPLPDDMIDLNPVVDNPPSITRGAHVQQPGPTMSRELAVCQMLEIANYFRRTEPSSPVPFLMERAARWANMSLTEWLEEMLTDSSSMREIHNVLTGQSQ